MQTKRAWRCHKCESFLGVREGDTVTITIDSIPESAGEKPVDHEVIVQGEIRAACRDCGAVTYLNTKSDPGPWQGEEE